MAQRCRNCIHEPPSVLGPKSSQRCSNCISEPPSVLRLLFDQNWLRDAATASLSRLMSFVRTLKSTASTSQFFFGCVSNQNYKNPTTTTTTTNNSKQQQKCQEQQRQHQQHQQQQLKLTCSSCISEQISILPLGYQQAVFVL